MEFKNTDDVGFKDTPDVGFKAVSEGFASPGKFIFFYNFIDYTPVASSENLNYPAANLKIYNRLKKHYRSAVIAEVSIVCDFGSSKIVSAIMLDDANFSNIKIQGNDMNIWDSPPYEEAITLMFDERTRRHKAIVMSAGFNYRYARIIILAQPPLDGLSIFRLGRLIFAEMGISFTKNPSFPYRFSAPRKYLKIEFEGGGIEKVLLESYKKFESSATLKRTSRSNEYQLWDIDNIDEDEAFIFFENLGDNSKAYVCQKDNSLEVIWECTTLDTNEYNMKELI